MYLPVYAGAGTPETVAERRARFIAVVYAAFRAGDFFEGTVGRPVGYQLRLVDITDTAAPQLLFDDRQQVVRMWRALGLTVFQVAEGDF